MTERYDVVVIGAGPGGFRAAKRCAQRGVKAAVIEKEFVGGTCLNWGCIPSKTLLASAHMLLSARSASELGIDIPNATVNWPVIQQRKDAIITSFRKGMMGSAKANNLTYIAGKAVAKSPGALVVDTEDGQSRIETDRLILATGSESIEIPSIPFDGQVVISSKEALSLPEIPDSMVIVGGGVIGCEMACAYAAMGTKVTIVEALERILPMEDEWVSRMLARELRKLGIEVRTGKKVTGVDTSTSPATVSIEDGESVSAEKVLVAVGRRAKVDTETVVNLGLEMNGPAIVVNDKLETNVPGVYAIGDAVGTTYLAHGATAEGDVAAANATGADEYMDEYDLIPRVVFTFPEVASIGLSEQRCNELGLDVTVGTGFFKANGRSVAHNQTAGQVRAVRDRATNRIIGITMVGEMVTEFVALGRALIGTTEKIGRITFPHPTVSETLEDAVHEALGGAALELS